MPKKAKTQTSAVKVTATDFWDTFVKNTIVNIAQKSLLLYDNCRNYEAGIV